MSKEFNSILGEVQNNSTLAEATRLQDIAAKVGFDWPHIHCVFDKVDEELTELKEAIFEKQDPNEIAAEFADLLFVLVNIARHLKLDPEQTLSLANQKFRQRFQFIEQHCFKKNTSLESLSLEEMDSLWDQAKN